MGYRRLIRHPLPASKEEQRRRLSICEECPLVIMKVRGACQDCGKPQTVTGSADTGWPCKDCGGSVHVREDRPNDAEIPKCGACGCALAWRTLPKGSFCPKGKW